MKKATLFTLSILLACLFSIPASLNAQALAKNETVKADSPIISWDKSKHVFGSIEHKKAVIAEFEFTNNSKAPIAVTKVGTTCGCTAADYPKEPVKPGEKAIVKIRYDAVSPGFFKKGAKIHFSDGSTKEIEIEGKVVVRRENIK